MSDVFKKIHRNKSKESYWLQVSSTKLLKYYSSNIDLQNVNQFK